MGRGINGLLVYFLREYPLRSAAITALSILAGFSEGLGVVTALPLLEVASPGSDLQDSTLMLLVESALDTLGLDLSLASLSLLIVLGMALKGLFLWLASYQSGAAVADVAADLRLHLIDGLLRARWSHFSDQSAGQLSNALIMEANQAAMGYANATKLLAVLVQVLIYFTGAMLISPTVALAALVVGAIIAVILRRLVDITSQTGHRQTVLMKSLAGRMADAIQGLKPIKAMSLEERIRPVLESETRQVNDARRRQVIAGGTMAAVHEPVLVAILMLGLYITLTQTSMTLPGVLVMAFLFHRLVGRIHQVQMSYLSLAESEAAFWSLRDTIERARRQRDVGVGQGKTFETLRDGIRLEDVVFSYGDAPVLTGTFLEIPAGDFVSIVGPSGAGKTTIVDLVTGLLQPLEGCIMVDDTPLRELDVATWRKNIGYVPQEMLLLNDTIQNNITLGDPSISPERVAEAVRQAGADEFIERLPDGLETMVGERGAKLSGGQRQRISIARALVRQPQLLILDEVTTSLDPVTERAICSTLRRIAGHVTILAISHQAAIAEVSDLVYRLEGGRVTAERMAETR